MAEHADGSIIVDTDIDSSGFKSGSAEMKSAINSLTNQINRLGPTFQKAMSGNTKAMGTFEAKASALKTKIAELEAKMSTLGSKRLHTEDYKQLSLELDKARAKLGQLTDRQAKMKATGVKETSSAYKSLQYDIDLTKQNIKGLEAAMAGMRKNGTAFQLGSATPEYQQMASSLAAAKQQMAEMDAAAGKMKANASTLPAIGQRIVSAFAKAGSVIKSSVVSGLKMAAGAAKNLLSHTLKAVTGMNKLGKSTGRAGMGFGSMLKSMLFFSAFSAVLKSLKEGIDALAKSSASFNNTMSQLKTSTAQLRNSFITAFAPILNVVVPILTILISKLASAINLIGQFFAALTGASSYTKAITQQQDYAASLDKTAGAAKEAKRQLAGFDEMNVLSDSSGGGGGGAGAGAGATFEDVPIDSGVAGVVDRIKEAFANGEYAEIGKIIGEGVNTIVGKLYDMLTGIDWEHIGSAFAEGLNGLVQGVDWELLGKTIGAYFMARLNFIYGAITTFDWAAAGNALGTAIKNLWDSIDWAKAGEALSTGFIGVLTTISEAIKTVDWQKVGNDVATFIASIDWGGVFTALTNAIGAALGGLAGFLWGLIDDAWQSLLDAGQKNAEEYGLDIVSGILFGILDGLENLGKWIVKNIFEPFINGFKDAFGIHSPSTVMQEQGGFIIDGLLLGITNAWNSITNFFGEALSSLTQKLSSGWETIKSGASTGWNKVKTTVSTAWTGIKTGVSNGASKVKETVSGAWSKVKEWTSAKWSSAKSTVTSTWDSIKSKTSSVGTGIKDSVSSAWANVKNNISSKLSSAKSSAATLWSSIKSTTTSQNNSIKSSLSSAWSSVKSSLSSTWSSIKSTASSTWSSIKNAIKNQGWSGVGSAITSGIKTGINNGWATLTNWIKEKAKSLLNAVKKTLGIHSPSRAFRDQVGMNIGLGIGEGVEDSTPAVLSTVSSVADAIADEFNAGEYGAVPTAEIDGSLTAFSDKITDSFAELMSRLQAIADGVTFAVPDVANGVAPYSVAAAVSGSKSHTPGTDASPNDDISSVVIQSVNNATVAIVKAIQEYSHTNINLDSDSLADSIINEINRRTRMNGKSPLLT